MSTITYDEDEEINGPFIHLEYLPKITAGARLRDSMRKIVTASEFNRTALNFDRTTDELLEEARVHYREPECRRMKMVEALASVLINNGVDPLDYEVCMVKHEDGLGFTTFLRPREDKV